MKRVLVASAVAVAAAVTLLMVPRGGGGDLRSDVPAAAMAQPQLPPAPSGAQSPTHAAADPEPGNSRTGSGVTSPVDRPAPIAHPAAAASLVAASRPPAGETDHRDSSRPPPGWNAAEPAEFRAVIEAVTPEVQKCFRNALAERPDAGAGTIVAAFDLAGTPDGGLIKQAEITAGSLGSPLDDLCVMNALAAARFPARDGQRIRMSYSFGFKP